ncbi:hypothetical protein JQN64_27655, partial [Escherichia coli]|nr:hypothetical protein [Escherichia coli]
LLKRHKKQTGKKSHTTHKHIPMSYGFYIKIDYSIIPKRYIKKLNIPTNLTIYRGTNAAKHFMKTMIEIGTKIEFLYKINIPMTNLTKDEEARFENATNCECCLKSFKQFNLIKCRDHNHFTGKFRSILCVACNFEMRNVSFVPIYFHNLSYDSHFIVRELGFNTKNIHVIPNSNEKYISFSKDISSAFRLKFVDTYRFMAESLSTL